MSEIEIEPISNQNYHVVSKMVGELLTEIMDAINEKAFNYIPSETERRVKELVEADKYWVFMAKDRSSGEYVGFVSIYESYALYSEGAYGTIPELYVAPDWRSNKVGSKLLKAAMKFAVKKGWHRLEVTTPPLPEFARTLEFYKSNNFKISGGRKLMVSINA
ncbi:N-acetyltransferase family protein [Sedimenticola sp.]|uniref:GNAT family N-acetyltransferase n=1 Tax=Sedimenticola sp. TaxID=1940285 RepID=UPI003D0A78C3